MKYLTFPFLFLLLPLIGFGCSSEEKETDSLILSSDSEIFFEQGIDFAATSGTHHLPHGSFFHTTGGVTHVNISDRLKLIPYETAIGVILTISSVILCLLIG